MKSEILINGAKTVLIQLTILFVFTTHASANYLIGSIYGGTRHPETIGFIALASVFLEYLVIRLTVGKYYTISEVVRAFLFINLITFPITQWLSWYVLFLAEIFPLVIEPYCYCIMLKNDTINTYKLAFAVIVANLTSFSLGFIAFINFEKIALIFWHIF